MNLLIDVTTPKSAPVAAGLIGACRRRGATVAVFFTGDGVKAAVDPALAPVLRWVDEAVACEHAWERHMPSTECPVTLGSQTNHSRLVGLAAHIVSL